MKALALITYRVFPALMGGQKGVALFYKYLQQHLSVTLVTSKDNKPSSEQNNVIPVLYANKTIFLNLFQYGVLKKLVYTHKPDVLIAEHSYAAWLALLLRRAAGVPFIIHSHNLEGLRFKEMNRWWWRIYLVYEQWIHQKADFNFFISEADEVYARKNFKLDAVKCTTITYGIEAAAPHQLSNKAAFFKTIGIWGNEKVLYFNGTLDYKPNYDAVLLLLHTIVPLLQKAELNFKIIITGNRASHKLKQTLKRHPQLIFLGYVPDVTPYYQHAHLFLNPILNASGVKTKVIEAIAHHCTVISTEAGASGIKKGVCGSKLRTVLDGDWIAFAEKILQCVTEPKIQTGNTFFETYSWHTIAANAAQKIAAAAQRYERM